MVPRKNPFFRTADDSITRRYVNVDDVDPRRRSYHPMECSDSDRQHNPGVPKLCRGLLPLPAPPPYGRASMPSLQAPELLRQKLEDELCKNHRSHPCSRPRPPLRVAPARAQSSPASATLRPPGLCLAVQLACLVGWSPIFRFKGRGVGQ